MITSGKLAPGERLNEAGLAESKTVYRSPFRESISLLRRGCLAEV